MVGNTLLVTTQVESREAVVTDGELFRSCCLLVLSSPLHHLPLFPALDVFWVKPGGIKR